MANHPNRIQKDTFSNPTPKEVKDARLSIPKLTQTGAANLVCTTLRAWQQWEAGDRRMHPGFWKLFNIEIEKLKLQND